METAALRRPPSFRVFKKCLLSHLFHAQHCRNEEEEERRRCVWIAAYIDLCRCFFLPDDSCFSPKSPTVFSDCFFGLVASNEPSPLMRSSRMLRRWRQFYGFLNLRKERETSEGLFKVRLKSSFFPPDLKPLSVLLTCFSTFSKCFLRALHPVDTQDKADRIGLADGSIWSLLCCCGRFYKGLKWLTFKVCLWGAT